jgi:hypothetical protein
MALIPAVFQLGMYSVQKTKVRTSPFTGMIEIHVRCLNQPITRLKNASLTNRLCCWSGRGISQGRWNTDFSLLLAALTPTVIGRTMRSFPNAAIVLAAVNCNRRFVS